MGCLSAKEATPDGRVAALGEKGSKPTLPYTVSGTCRGGLLESQIPYTSEGPASGVRWLATALLLGGLPRLPLLPGGKPPESRAAPRCRTPETFLAVVPPTGTRDPDPESS